MTRTSLAVSFCALLFAAAPPAHGFSLLPPPGVNPQLALQTAARWSGPFGLADGIQVAVEPGFAANLGAASPADVAAVNQSVSNALAAWESPVLDVDVTFDASGLEVGVFAVPGNHPAFAAAPSAFGIADVSYASGSRPLTNGSVYDGLIVVGASVFVNTTNTAAFAAFFGLTPQQQLDSLQRLVMHEFGHALGLGHGNSNNIGGVQVNFDTDNDPLNAMVIDPLDPFGDLIVSMNSDNEAIMSNRACGGTTFCPSLVFTSLRPDDVGGRDALYPIPEPATGALAAVALAALALLRRRVERG